MEMHPDLEILPILFTLVVVLVLVQVVAVAVLVSCRRAVTPFDPEVVHPALSCHSGKVELQSLLDVRTAIQPEDQPQQPKDLVKVEHLDLQQQVTDSDQPQEKSDDLEDDLEDDPQDGHSQDDHSQDDPQDGHSQDDHSQDDPQDGHSQDDPHDSHFDYLEDKPQNPLMLNLQDSQQSDLEGPNDEQEADARQLGAMMATPRNEPLPPLPFIYTQYRVIPLSPTILCYITSSVPGGDMVFQDTGAPGYAGTNTNFDVHLWEEPKAEFLERVTIKPFINDN